MATIATALSCLIFAAPPCMEPSALAPIPCRNDLAIAAQRHFSRLGRAVEVGVYQGNFSAYNIRYWQGEYFAVDSWGYRPGPGDTDKNFGDKAINLANYEIAAANLAPAGARAKQVRLQSLKAARTFANESFDWMYIDALHTYSGLLRDLQAWWPKLRPGGLLSGDDYGDSRDTPFLPAKRWAKPTLDRDARERTGFTGFGATVYPDMARKLNWGVVRVAQEWAAHVKAELHVTWLPDCYPYPAWYMIKPGCA